MTPDDVYTELVKALPLAAPVGIVKRLAASGIESEPFTAVRAERHSLRSQDDGRYVPHGHVRVKPTAGLFSDVTPRQKSFNGTFFR